MKNVKNIVIAAVIAVAACFVCNNQANAMPYNRCMQHQQNVANAMNMIEEANAMNNMYCYHCHGYRLPLIPQVQIPQMPVNPLYR